jgi:hypothetical protein
MAPAGNQHKRGRADGLVGDERNETGLLFFCYVYRRAMVSSFLPFFLCAYILPPLLSREKAQHKGVDGVDIHPKERERGTTPFLFSILFYFLVFTDVTRARREDQTDAQTGNYHVAVDVLFIHVWQLRNFFFFFLKSAQSTIFKHKQLDPNLKRGIKGKTNLKIFFEKKNGSNQYRFLNHFHLI